MKNIPKPDYSLINNQFDHYKLNTSQLSITLAELNNQCLAKNHNYADLNSPKKFNYLQLGKYFILKSGLIQKLHFNPLSKEKIIRFDTLYSLEANLLSDQTLVTLTEFLSGKFLLVCFGILEHGLLLLNFTSQQCYSTSLQLEPLLNFIPEGFVINQLEIISSSQYSNHIHCFALQIRLSNIDTDSHQTHSTHLVAICSLDLMNNSELNIINIIQGNGQVIDFQFSSKGYFDEYILLSLKPFELIYPKSITSSEMQIQSPVPSNLDTENLNFKWYQTSEDVTISIHTPALIPSSKSITCSLKRNTLKLQIQDISIDLKRDWFAPIIEDSSYWTIEENKLITLHLQKLNEKTRWPHMFIEDDGILESVDPSDLLTITDNLEKYTENLDGPFQPTSLHDRMEVEDNLGDAMTFTIKTHDKHTVLHQSPVQHSWLGSPLPLIDSLQELPFSVATKFDVHGLVYEVSNNTIQHTSSLSAIGYIQASKKERKYTFYHPITFDTYIIEYQNNIFVYYYPNQGDEGVQKVVNLATNEEIIGVAGYQDGRGIILLTESKIYHVYSTE